MAYFNHAFSKAFYAATQNQTTTETTADLGGGGALGEFAFADSNYKIMNAVGVAGQAGGFYLAQSSFQTVDTIGNNPGHGGYTESHKSKMIVKKYISDMWISDCTNETAAISVIQLDPISTATVAAGSTVLANATAKSCFPCGSDPIMRVDVKGTAALRLLNHNAYQSLSGSLPMPRSGATVPADGVDMCCLTQGVTTLAGLNGIDHAGIADSIVAMNWRDQFNNDPIMNKLGTAELWVSRTAANQGAGATTTVYDLVVDGSANETAIYAGGARGVHTTSNSGVAVVLVAIAVGSEGTTIGSWGANSYRVVIRLNTSCELQTQFTNCSFDTRDFYLMGGLSTTTMLQDEVGQPCVPCQGYVIDGDTVATATDGGGGATTPNVTSFKQRRTSSETAINDMLLTESYMQSPYNQGNRDSSRFREQEQMSGIVTEMGRDSTTSTCNGFYRVYHLLHSVPRFNNPSGVFDNDQYHYKVYVKCSGAGPATTTIDADWLAIAIQAGVMKLDGSGIVATVADLEAKGGDY